MSTEHPKASESYIPGVCNINSQEVARRRLYAYIGTSVFIVGLLILVLLKLNHWLRLALFPAAFLAASGSLQAKHNFCTGYAAAKKQNASEGSTVASDVTEQAAIAKDKRRGLQINLQAAAISALLCLLSVPIKL